MINPLQYVTLLIASNLPELATKLATFQDRVLATGDGLTKVDMGAAGFQVYAFVWYSADDVVRGD